MASSSTPGPAAGGHSYGGPKPPRILACVLCQHRKIKCDRTFPCANCTKFVDGKANVSCTPSTPAPARKRRRPNQDLQERLARCEELLKVYSSAKPPDEDSSPMMETPQNMFNHESALKWNPPGKLIVEDDGGVRFVDSVMLGTIHEELRAMREIIDSEDNEDITPDTTATPDDNSDLLLLGSMHGTGGGESGSPAAPATLEELQPSAAHIFRLWQIFLERVNPLTKIVHVPTLQPYLVDATSTSPNVPPSVRTLLFAIYTLSTVSMTPDECLNMLGYSRETALQRFSNGVRLSLIRTNFMKSYDLETLQALVIYLISLQGRYNRHASWILNGVVLRIAQKMGLHRDGEVLGLSPFETEIRRRVWWQIIMVDAKYALMSGLSHSMMPRVWDTKEPKNVNDADLFPAATEPVQDRDGPTEMIMVMVFNRIARFLADTPGVEPLILMSDHEVFRGPNGPSSLHIEMYRGLIAKLATSLLEITDKFCDPTAGPLHEMAVEVKAEILQKLENLLMPAQEREFSDEVKTPADNVFQVAVEAATHDNELKMKAKNNLFAWFSRLYFQDNMFMFIVGQLCIRTTGKLVEKAWIAVENTYDQYPDLYDVTQRSYYQIASFVLRAWRTRVDVLRARASLTGQPVQVPEFIAKLRATMPVQDDTASTSSGGAAQSATEPSIKSEASSASLSKVPGLGMSAMPSAGPSTGPGTVTISNSYDPMDSINTATVADPPVPSIDELSLLGDDKAMLPTTNDQVLDQLLAQSYMDPNTIDWDMWGSMMPPGSVATPFDNFNTMPNTQW
ncbi:c6 zinc finger domain containing protein [Sporothrix schenckii 1099-18]|uniref:C6 zinc finger domain containing protein n=1 Tax=Sporothrix schenckii 1099-18 TaxID=1397361 RepID=A0A0F2MHU1_SPOSC|nr:c6 zinc finger domain containing protein [Sporothrix schenckii 1099-18]KJR89192.1 c6 zinc finger domain containing protein [Sporothrix schenckii 1099-18]